MPVLLAYGIFSGFHWLFYPWLIVSFFVISAIPVLIGAIISIPLMYIISFIKQNRVIQTLVYVVFGLGVIGGVVYLITLIPPNFDLIASFGKVYWQIQDFLNGFNRIFKPLAYIVQMICGKYIFLKWHLFSMETLYIMLSLIGVICALFGLSYVISRPLFFKMASKPFEYKKKTITKAYKNKTRNLLKTSLVKEFRTNFRESKFVYNYGMVLVVLPIAILLLNKIFSAMNTRLQGAYMIFSFNILIIMLILLASNNLIASIYSSDGRTAYLMKTLPHNHSRYLFPKLVIPIVISFVSIIVTVIIFGLFNDVKTYNLILLMITLFSFYIGHMMWSAEMDLMNPQNEQYATTGEVNNNPNERKSTILAFLISFLVFGLSLFFFMERAKFAWLKIAIMGLVFAVSRIYFYFAKIKVYYGEK